MTLDITQITQPPQEAEHRAPPVTVRLRHSQTGVQLVVAEHKAARLIAQGYKPVPKAEQPKRPAVTPTAGN